MTQTLVFCSSMANSLMIMLTNSSCLWKLTAPSLPEESNTKQMSDIPLHPSQTDNSTVVDMELYKKGHIYDSEHTQSNSEQGEM